MSKIRGRCSDCGRVHYMLCSGVSVGDHIDVTEQCSIDCASTDLVIEVVE